MTKVVVDAGICGFTTTIEVIRLSSRRVGIRVDSECEMVSKIGVQLREVDWRDVLGQRETLWSTNPRQCPTHITCPVPMAILKATEVEVGAALPRDIVIRFESTNQR